MFKTLLSYTDKGFWKENPSIFFDTLYEEGVYEIIGAFYSKVYYQDETDVFRFYSYTNLADPELFSEYVANVKELSLYDTGITADYGDTLLTLVTCSYQTENGRFVVVARKHWLVYLQVRFITDKKNENCWMGERMNRIFSSRQM